MKNLMYILFSLAGILTFQACTKEIEDSRPNPFESGNNGSNQNNQDSLDPLSIEGLHQRIFSIRCANPTCHDGSFEPDFRTVQSTYYSLVYHPVIKNDTNRSYLYRVLPGNADQSWLVERLISNDPVLGRMPLYSTPLNETEINWIKTWINKGAKDVNGNNPVLPNLSPNIIGYGATNIRNHRIDENRENGFDSPFLPHFDSVFRILINVKDDITPTAQLKTNTLKCSYDMNNFSNAKTYQAVYLFGDLWMVQIPAQEFNLNTQVFFRYYVNDGDHAKDAEFPENTTPNIFKHYYSFKLVKP